MLEIEKIVFIHLDAKNFFVLLKRFQDRLQGYKKAKKNCLKFQQNNKRPAILFIFIVIWRVTNIFLRFNYSL